MSWIPHCGIGLKNASVQRLVRWSRRWLSLRSALPHDSIPQFSLNTFPQGFGSKHPHVRHPGQHPADKLFPPRGFQPHLDTAVPARSQLLAGVPQPLGDVDRQFRLDQRAKTASGRSVITERGYVATRQGLECFEKQLYAEALQRGLGRLLWLLIVFLFLSPS
jgi:hypothetical protein